MLIKCRFCKLEFRWVDCKSCPKCIEKALKNYPKGSIINIKV